MKKLRYQKKNYPYKQTMPLRHHSDGMIGLIGTPNTVTKHNNEMTMLDRHITLHIIIIIIQKGIDHNLRLLLIC